MLLFGQCYQLLAKTKQSFCGIYNRFLKAFIWVAVCSELKTLSGVPLPSLHHPHHWYVQNSLPCNLICTDSPRLGLGTNAPSWALKVEVVEILPKNLFVEVKSEKNLFYMGSYFLEMVLLFMNFSLRGKVKWVLAISTLI